MSHSTSQLSYRVVEPLRPDQQAGIWVARWLSVACAIQAFLTLGRMMQGSWERSAYYSFRYRWYGPSRPMLETLVELSAHGLLCLMACLMGMCAIGLAARGKAFRRLTIATLCLFCLALFIQAAVPLLQQSQISRGMSGWPLESQIRIVQTIVMGWLMNVGGVLLPIVTVVALTRAWMREALEAAEVVNSSTIISRMGMVAVVLAGVGLLLNWIAYTKWSSVMELLGVMAYLRPRDMSDLWLRTVEIALPACMVVQLAGGFLVCRSRLIGARLLTWQAQIAVVLNVVTLFYAIAGRAIFSNVVGSVDEGLPAESVMRFMSITIDLILWMYFGSPATRETLSGEPPIALAVASQAGGEAHAVAR